MKRILFLLFLLLPASLLIRGCIPLCGFAGSYPCVKSWELDVTEAELKTIIEEVKKEHPEICPAAKDTQYVSRQSHYWYMIYFYFPDTKEYAYTWIRESYSSEKDCTSFALVGFLEEGKAYKNINQDYNWPENAKHINRFKEKILKPVREKIEKRRK